MNHIIEVFKTTDYDSIKIHPLQRPVNVGHVMRLKSEIEKNNRLAQNPAVVNEEGYLVDGQHRFTVAKMLGIPFYYRIGDATIDEIRNENITHRKWTPMDYVKSYANQGKENYQWLVSFIESKKWLGYTGSMQVVKSSRSEPVLKSVKTGDLIVPQDIRERSYLIADQIEEISKHNTKLITTARFIAVLARIMKKPDYDHSRMMDKLEYQSRKLVKCSNRAQVMEMFEEIYNYRAGKNQRVSWSD